MLIYIYRFLSNLFFLPVLFFFLVRLILSKETLNSIFQKFFLSRNPRPKGDLVWINGVSIGEAKTGLIIAEEIKKSNPNVIILFSTSTLTSYKLLSKMKNDYINIFAPLDISFVANSFLNYWKPKSVIFIESEIWPSIFSLIKKKSMRLNIFNARISKKSFNNWKRLIVFSNSIFSLIDSCFVQDKESMKRFKLLGVKKINRIENLKFLSPKLEVDNDIFNKFKKQLRLKRVVILFSSHQNEEKMLLESFKVLSKKIKNLFFIIVPRHINRLKKITDEFNNEKVSYLLKTDLNLKIKNENFLIVGTFGELGSFFKLSQIALVGGSFSKNGGHNPIETKDFDCSIIFGPHMENFIDIKEKIILKKAGFEVKDHNQLNEIIYKLFKNKKLRLQTNQNFKKLCYIQSDKSRAILKGLLK